MALLSFGPIGNVAADAIARLTAERPDLRISHIDLRFAKPLDEALILDMARTHRRLITLEDGVRKGGVGTAVLELLADHDLSCPVQRIGLPDHFVEHGTPTELYHLCGMDTEAITQALSDIRS